MELNNKKFKNNYIMIVNFVIVGKSANVKNN